MAARRTRPEPRRVVAENTVTERPDGTRRVAFTTAGKSRVDQDQQRATDINAIWANYKKNGTLPNVPRRNPLWGDFTDPQDLQDMLDRIHTVEEVFAEMPAAVRELAQTPVGLLELANDPAREAELVAAGLELLPDSAFQEPTEPDSSGGEADPQPAPAGADPGNATPEPTDAT